MRLHTIAAKILLKHDRRKIVTSTILTAFSPDRDATGKFPEYPDVDDGGSAAIFKKREEPVRKIYTSSSA